MSMSALINQKCAHIIWKENFYGLTSGDLSLWTSASVNSMGESPANSRLVGRSKPYGSLCSDDQKNDNDMSTWRRDLNFGQVGQRQR